MVTRQEDDPVRRRRRRIARLAREGKRLGYSFFAIAIGTFVVAVLTDFPQVAVTVVVAALFVGSVLLAPAIVFGYGVRAAEREDRRRGPGELSP